MTVRVLLVDDQAIFRAAARAVIELIDGFEVVGEAASGEASLEAVLRLSPSLVLMDIGLPGIDGIEATRRIVSVGRAPIVVLLSTHEAADYASRAAACGASGYLSKTDFGPESLAAAWAAAAGRDTRAP